MEIVHDKFPEVVGSFDAHFTDAKCNVEWKTFFSIEDFFLWAIEKSFPAGPLAMLIRSAVTNISHESKWELTREGKKVTIKLFNIQVKENGNSI